MNSPTVSQVSYLEITATHEGQRIDNFLVTHLKGVPKSHIYRILRSGEIRVNKGRIKQTYRLQTGDIIRLPPIRVAESVTITPQANILQVLENNIIYQNDALLVLNKPSGMAVHGGSGISFGVIEGLRALYPKEKSLELVHRLDRDTSGCLMIAKKRSMLKQLHQILREDNISKEYLALVRGQWNPRVSVVNAPLQKNVLQSGERVVRVNPEGKEAVSEFYIQRKFTIATLVRVKLVTGRTHQIRVHATHSGHPIAGDEKYGDEQFNEQMIEFKLKRLFLHAAQLSITLPDTQLQVTAPLPAALQDVLQQLELKYGKTV
ncbi:MAG: 23S rRNA pseudouridine(955/2504/2580) synthase RluC [Thiotrichaceae bacterium]